jgi:hypothetical protein
MDLSRVAAAALAVPGCLVAMASAGALVLTVVDEPPMWPHEQVNLAEAAGVRDEPEVVRLIERGEDPSARYPVRAGLIFGRAMALTPLEAAVANEDPEMVVRLVAKGAALDAQIWAYLRCAAEGDTIRAALDQLRPSGASPGCDGVSASWKAE